MIVVLNCCSIKAVALENIVLKSGKGQVCPFFVALAMIASPIAFGMMEICEIRVLTWVDVKAITQWSCSSLHCVNGVVHSASLRSPAYCSSWKANLVSSGSALNICSSIPSEIRAVFFEKWLSTKTSSLVLFALNTPLRSVAYPLWDLSGCWFEKSCIWSRNWVLVGWSAVLKVSMRLDTNWGVIS